MKYINIKTILLFSAITLTWAGCKKENQDPPKVIFTSPIVTSDESLLKRVHISVDAFAADNKKIAKVEFFVDNELLPNGTDNEAPWEYDWDCNDKFGETRVLKAVATDNIGKSHDTSMNIVVINAVEKTKMTTSRYAFTSNVVNGKIYVIGGYNKDYTAFQLVEEYDPATNKWTTKNPSNTGHAAHSSCVINNKIYVFGGDRGQQWTGVVEAYDPATDQWTTKDSLPIDSNAPLGMSTATDFNGKAYIIGGFTNPEPARVCEYNPISDSWRLTNSYKKNYNAEAITLNGVIYFIGGCPFRTMSFCDNPSDSLQVYDPVLDSWSNRKSMKSPHSGHSSTVLNNKIYIMGGASIGKTTPNTNVEVYDPATDSWKNLAPLPKGMTNFSCNTVNGKIYIMNENHLFEYIPE